MIKSLRPDDANFVIYYRPLGRRIDRAPETSELSPRIDATVLHGNPPAPAACTRIVRNNITTGVVTRTTSSTTYIVYDVVTQDITRVRV